jgi:hypothetical protein
MALSTWSIKLDGYQRHIIMRRLIAAESLYGTPYFSTETLRLSHRVFPESRPEPLSAKQLAVRVHGFGYAIGKHEQRAARRKGEASFIQVGRWQ